MSAWKERIFNIKGKYCQKCKKTSDLSIHHILPRSLYPNKRDKDNNLIVLCEECHNHFHNRYLKGHLELCNEETLTAWLHDEIHPSLEELYKEPKRKFLTKKEKKRIRRQMELEGKDMGLILYGRGEQSNTNEILQRRNGIRCICKR